uniref:Speedy/RINGO cell cycle regulator family member E4 n=1 Tax=Oryctolagus cuniculus TaxID=9986 RepID=G1TTH2_RABIT|nr:speedy protein E4 [Oryctolagus cuniculus]XP_051695019.1 speedy protein E4 [Oryctolagus cuniculus]
MAGCEPHVQAEAQSPQPSSLGCPPEVVLDHEAPGPSAPWVDPSSGPQSPACNGKRAWSAAFPESAEALDSEGELMPVLQGRLASLLLPGPAPGPPETWGVEWLCGLKMRLKRRRASPVLPEHHAVFARLLEDPVVKRFLAWDKNLRVSDKYLLAMVVAYFSRAGLFSWQYQRLHFFIALYVASDMEEDNQASKQAIFAFLYGQSRAQRPLFHKLRLQFIRSMGWQTRVTREECEEIQAYDPELWVWRRDRTLIP